MIFKKILIINFLTILNILLFSFNAISKNNLSIEINNYISKYPNPETISIFIESYRNHYIYERNSDKKVSAASLIKISVMIEVMEKIADNELSLDDNLVLTKKDVAGGSGELKNYKLGSQIPIRKIIELMITISDNTATNMLINKVGVESINSKMKKLGLKNTYIELLMFDLEAYRKGKDNFTSAKDISILLNKIYNRKVANPRLCNFMINTLKKTKNRNAIPKHLPNISIAHKTGSLLNIQGDAGIVFNSKPYSITVFVQNTPTKMAEEIIADISKIAFNNI